jgi:TonB family protein
MTKIAWLAACLLAYVVPAAAAEPAPVAAPEPSTAARATANLASLFSDKDYPAEALRNEEEGIVAFRLAVGADGKPTQCSITATSGSASLDDATCRILMERARFTPARDAQGKPTTDEVSGRINWKMVEDAPPRMGALFTLWSVCAMGEAAKLVPGDLPAAEIARRSLAPCSALEALVAKEVSLPLPLESHRAGVAQMIEAAVDQARAALKAPPPVETAGDP